MLNLVTSLGGQMLTTVLKFVTRTVFIYTLGKQYLGINGLFADILTMLSLTELGIDTAINFKLYKPLAENDEKRVRVLMKFYKQAYRIVGATILLIGLGLIPLLPFLIKDYDTLEPLGINATLIFILYLLQSVCSYLFFAYRSAVMKANQKKYILDVADYAVTILTNIAQILVLYFLRSFVIYTAIVIFFNIFKNLVNAVISQKYYPQFLKREKESLKKDEIIGLLKDCGALFVYRINNVVVKATDNLVISTFLGLTWVGLYSNYLLFHSTIKLFLWRLYEAVRASMGNLFATNDIDVTYKFFEIMNYLTAVFYGTAGIGVAVCANELITVWVGEDYVIAQPFSILMGIEILFIGLTNNLGQIRSVSGVFRQMWYRPVIGVVVNIVASVVLVQFIGIYGVILGTIISQLFSNFLVDPSLIMKYSFNGYKPVSAYYKKNLLYLLVLSAITAVDIFICNHVFTGHGWFSVIVHIIITGVSVPLVMIGIYWRSHECKYLVALSIRTFKKILKKAGLLKSAPAGKSENENEEDAGQS